VSKSKTFSGMPISFDRPKWLKATYKTSRMAVLAPDVAKQNETPGYKVMNETSTQKVEFEVVSVPEVYALDVKRPMAGTAEWDIQFPDGKQYPKEIKNKVEDKTISDTAAAVEKLAAAAGKAAKAQDSGGSSTVQSVSLGESIDRIEFYDVNHVEQGPVLVMDGRGRIVSSSSKYGK
jgi:hypothetical protein